MMIPETVKPDLADHSEVKLTTNHCGCIVESNIQICMFNHTSSIQPMDVSQFRQR